jgi:hypothetical protein
MAGRRAGAETAELTPWRARELAARKLGRVRREVTQEALDGRLPDSKLRMEYKLALEEFEDAQAFWLASRSATSGA